MLVEKSRLDKSEEIVVTQDMIAAGIEELRQHRLPGDWPYLLECVFRAMAYAKLSASSIKAARNSSTKAASATGD